MKFILLDSKNREVKYAEFKDLLEEGRKFIDGYLGCAGEIDSRNTLYIDDEGLLKINHDTNWLSVNNIGIFAGNGIIAGLNRETGETIDTNIDIDNFSENIEFFDNPQLLSDIFLSKIKML